MDLTFKKLRTEASSQRSRNFLTSNSEDDSSRAIIESSSFTITATFLSPTPFCLEDDPVLRRVETISRERNNGK